MTRVQSSCVIAAGRPMEVPIHSMLSLCISNMDADFARQPVPADEEFVRETRETVGNTFGNIHDDSMQDLINAIVGSNMSDAELFQYVELLKSPIYLRMQEIFNNHLNAVITSVVAYTSRLRKDMQAKLDARK